jgi:hypothetical protein
MGVMSLPLDEGGQVVHLTIRSHIECDRLSKLICCKPWKLKPSRSLDTRKLAITPSFYIIDS